MFRTQEYWFYLLDARLAGDTGCGRHEESKFALDRSTDGIATSIKRGLGRRRRCRRLHATLCRRRTMTTGLGLRRGSHRQGRRLNIARAPAKAVPNSARDGNLGSGRKSFDEAPINARNPLSCAPAGLACAAMCSARSMRSCSRTGRETPIVVDIVVPVHPMRLLAG